MPLFFKKISIQELSVISSSFTVRTRIMRIITAERNNFGKQVWLGCSTVWNQIKEMEVDSVAMLAASIQHKSKDRQIFVTSVRQGKRCPSGSRKSVSKTIHLLPHMAEFVEDQPSTSQVQPVDLDQFELAKQTVQSQFFDCRNNHGNQCTDKSTRPLSHSKSINLTAKDITKRVSQQLKAYTDALNRSAKYGACLVSRDKSPVVQSVKTRIKQSLTNYIKHNEKKSIQAHFNQITDQYQDRLEKLHDNIVKDRETIEKEKEMLEKRILELQLSIVQVKAERDELVVKLGKTQQELEQSKASQTSLETFVKEYRDLCELYPGMSCAKLVQEYQRLQNICVSKLCEFDLNFADKIQSQKRPLLNEIKTLTKDNDILRRQVNDMSRILEAKKLGDQLEEKELQSLKASKQELKLLQNKILQIYVQWQENRSDIDKQIIKELGAECSYTGMLDQMNLYRKQISTDGKVRDFLRKILGLISAARRRIFDKAFHDRVRPQKVLESIVKYVACLKGQKKGGSTPIRRSHTKDESEFLKS